MTATLQYPIRPVVHICWACRGTGWRLKSACPVIYCRCWACYGARGFGA